MKHTLISRLGLSLPLAIVIAFSAHADAPPPVITVTGNGQVTVPATHVEFRVSIERNAPTPAAASTECARAAIAVTKSLHASGLPDGDILASRSTVGPHVEGDDSHQRRKGYDAVNTLHIDTRLVDQLGVVIDAALQGGATSVDEVEFGLLDPDAPRQAAIAKAVAAAHRDADALAHAAGGTLGTLVSLGTDFDLTNAADRPVRYIRVGHRVVEDEHPAIPVVAGDVIVSARVSARWLFVPATN